MANKKEMTSHKGLIILMICGCVAVGLIIGCVFFPEELFGFLLS